MNLLDKEIKKVGVIGVGKLGLAYALSFEQAGLHVVASSYKKEYVDELTQKKINNKEPYIADLLKTATNIQFTTDNHRVIDHSDIIYVMVATPSTEHGDYDMSAVFQVAEDFLRHQNDVSDKILIIGSTVNPGVTDQVQEMLKEKNVHVVYSPTFVAQGSVITNLKNPHTLSIGTANTAVAEQCKKLFLKIISDSEATPMYQLKPLTAEILKLAGNCRATLLISFYNMIGQYLLQNNLEDDLKSAMMYLNYVKIGTRFKFDFGFGGPCYPRDNRAFVHYVDSINTSYPFGTVVDQFNQDHNLFLVAYLFEKNKDNLPFYFEYISYKKGVEIFEESSQYNVCVQLLKSGAEVYIEDTDFLPLSIKSDLSDQFGTKVKFLKIKNDTAKVYLVDFNQSLYSKH
jgi:UDPglucose 6-dehydrogenase